MTTKANVYEMVTDRIIAELEKGNIPWRWQKPWTGVRSGAYNRITKKPYSIINQILRKRLIFRYYQKNIRLLFSSRSTLTIHI